MLEPMQKDAAIEVTAAIRANIYRQKKLSGDSEELAQDRETVWQFKREVRNNDALTWDDVLAFSAKWLSKYPDTDSKQAAA